MTKNIMIIANPKSGKSNNDKYEEIIKRELNDYFKDIQIEYTEDKGHATELAKKAGEEGYDSVCSMGGDGTLAEVLNGLIRLENPPKLLIFPGGTGNIMSQALGYSQNKQRVFSNIDFENAKSIDIGEANGQAFGFLLSIGSVPESINEVSNEEKDKFGIFAYVSSIFKTIGHEKEYNLRVEVDEHVYEGRVDHLGISVSEKFGPLKVNNLNADYNDGLLHVFILKDKSLFKKAKIGMDSIFGTVTKNESIEYFSGKNIKITNLTEDCVHVDMDGDKGPELPLEINVIHDKVKVYVPKNK